MSKSQFNDGKMDDEAVLALADRVWRRHAKKRMAVRVARALTFQRRDHNNPADQGTFIPKPFHTSKLLLKYQGADLFEAALDRVALLTANRPDIQVSRVSSAKGSVKKNVEEAAAVHEDFLNAVLFQVDRMGWAHQTIGWEQAISGAGYYVSYPYEAGFGLPDREYAEELDDEQIAAQRDKEFSSYRKVNPKTGQAGFPETTQSWFRRRQEAAEGKAIKGESLFVLEALTADAVATERDILGTRVAVVVEEIAAETMAAGGTMARDIALANGLSGEDAERFGFIVVDKKLIAGPPVGSPAGEADSDVPDKWTRIRVFTREEVYIAVAPTEVGERLDGASIVFSSRHPMGQVPCWPVPGVVTGSPRPEEEFAPLLGGLIALQPFINQVVTLASNVSTFNSIPRWIAEADSNGKFLKNPETGTPLVVTSVSSPGLDPAKAQILPPGYRWRQLTIDSKDLIQLLDFFVGQADKMGPTEAESGTGSLRGPAWARQIALTQSKEINGQAVDYHAYAVGEMSRAWTHACRILGHPIKVLGAPGRRTDGKSMRALIEFDPETASEELIFVRQSQNTARDRTILQQQGLELVAVGKITDREYHEEYRERRDPDAAVRAQHEQAALNLILPKIIEATVQEVLADLPEHLAAEVPGVARRLAEQAAAANANVMQPAGVVEAGMGAPAALPEGAAPPAPVSPAAPTMGV